MAIPKARQKNGGAAAAADTGGTGSAAVAGAERTVSAPASGAERIDSAAVSGAGRTAASAPAETETGLRVVPGTAESAAVPGIADPAAVAGTADPAALPETAAFVAASESAESAAASETIVRHPLAVRLTHWTIAVSGLTLLFSGFGELPMYKRYNVVKLPGLGWSDDFEIHLIIHYIAAAFFAAGVVFHMLYHWRRREFAALPRKGDGAESWAIIKSMVLRKPEPASGKFLAEQRLAYLAIGATSLVLLLTGVIKSYKNLGAITLDPLFLQIVTMTHTVAAMMFLFLFLAHLGAFVVKANRPLVLSMFSGRVKRGYAEHRHVLWAFDRSDRGETAAEAAQRRAELGKAEAHGESHAGGSEPPGGPAGGSELRAGPAAGAQQPGGAVGAAELRARCPHRVTVKDVLRLVPGVMILASVSLGVWVHPGWFFVSVFAGVNLLQSAFTRWCLLESMLRKLGVPECP